MTVWFSGCFQWHQWSLLHHPNIKADKPIPLSTIMALSLPHLATRRQSPFGESVVSKMASNNFQKGGLWFWNCGRILPQAHGYHADKNEKEQKNSKDGQEKVTVITCQDPKHRIQELTPCFWNYSTFGRRLAETSLSSNYSQNGSKRIKTTNHIRKLLKCLKEKWMIPTRRK